MYPKHKKKVKRKGLSFKDKKIYEEVNRLQPVCVICGKPYPLNRHHIRHSGTRLNYIGNIAVVCGPVTDDDSCHAKIHNNEKYWKPILVKKVNEIYGFDLPLYIKYQGKESDLI
jgi:hypothetical protein